MDVGDRVTHGAVTELPSCQGYRLARWVGLTPDHGNVETEKGGFSAVAAEFSKISWAQWLTTASELPVVLGEKSVYSSIPCYQSVTAGRFSAGGYGGGKSEVKGQDFSDAWKNSG